MTAHRPQGRHPILGGFGFVETPKRHLLDFFQGLGVIRAERQNKTVLVAATATQRNRVDVPQRHLLDHFHDIGQPIAGNDFAPDAQRHATSRSASATTRSSGFDQRQQHVLPGLGQFGASPLFDRTDGNLVRARIHVKGALGHARGRNPMMALWQLALCWWGLHF